MANPWWAGLSDRSNATLQGMLSSPFVLDPSKLTGDATLNRALMYAGSVPKPEPTVNPTPNAALGTAQGGLGPVPMGNQFASTGAASAPAAAPAAAPKSVFSMAPNITDLVPALDSAGRATGSYAPAAPTSTEMTVSQPSAPARAPSPFANVEYVDEAARKRSEEYLADLTSKGAFDPANAYDGLIPAIQRRLVEMGGAIPQAGWSAQGERAPEVPKGVQGFYAMTGQRATPLNDDSGASSNAIRYDNSYQFVPTAQPQQAQQQFSVPAGLRDAVMQLVQGWPGANG